ncbi:MAG: polysaccharide deacetylase family protein [Planctomycetota bacterium]
MLTVVMYHYVRDPAGTRYPSLKSLATAEFDAQLDHLARHHRVVGVEAVIEAVLDPPGRLPANAALLTFDDGFREHLTYVLPRLIERGWQGSFFPSSRPVLREQVLDVHKLHFVLATGVPIDELVQWLCAMLDERRRAYDLPPTKEYWRRLAVASRFDPPEVIFVKRLLQRELPEALRAELTGALFRRYVTDDEAAFARELYVSCDDLRRMHAAGMYIGHHGATHRWLDALPAAEQAREVEEGLEFLVRIGAPADRWVIAYPYGAHTADLRAQVHAHGGVVGLTTATAVADLARHDPLALPRLDTNDLPPRRAGGN